MLFGRSGYSGRDEAGRRTRVRLVGPLAVAFASLMLVGCANETHPTATSPIGPSSPAPSNRSYVGVFTLTGDLATARRAHTATLLPSGRVLIAGGAESGSLTTLASSELYDPAIGTFTRTGDLTAARFAHTATLLPSGHVLIAGGFNPAGGSNALASAELYDPASEPFTRTGDLTVPRLGHTATLLPDGWVLIAGGTNT